MNQTTYTILGSTCVCQTWDRGSPWHINAVRGHHAGCLLLNLDEASQKLAAGQTPAQLVERMQRFR